MKYALAPICLLLLAACEDGGQPAAKPNTSATAQPATAHQPFNPECSEVFTGNHSMVYDKADLTIDAGKCREFTVIVRNIGYLPKNARGHNFVISKDTDQNGILADGVDLGAKSDFLKPGDPRIIAHTKLAGGGEEQHVTFKTNNFRPGNNYVYFCSFLGHHKMRGKVNIIYPNMPS
ncbi:azurin [Conchiformibius kuhniae]|uniref:Azurin n=1 Tax=Conchiformibius kuhniae TaxID=211502 RepID=A0A8T9MT06_9NEIS|nr:azurin [Conchiformibius kuhniae]UOP04401.1 azurin [Conchiformibius kuhniae]